MRRNETSQCCNKSLASVLDQSDYRTCLTTTRWQYWEESALKLKSWFRNLVWPTYFQDSPPPQVWPSAVNSEAECLWGEWRNVKNGWFASRSIRGTLNWRMCEYNSLSDSGISFSFYYDFSSNKAALGKSRSLECDGGSAVCAQSSVLTHHNSWFTLNYWHLTHTHLLLVCIWKTVLGHDL